MSTDRLYERLLKKKMPGRSTEGFPEHSGGRIIRRVTVTQRWMDHTDAAYWLDWCTEKEMGTSLLHKRKVN